MAPRREGRRIEKGMADMECKIAVAWMHIYLDGELGREGAESLKQHMRECPACRARFDALAQTEAFVRAVPSVPVPDGLGSRILAAVPNKRRPVAWAGFVRRHPGMAAAAMFVVVMLSSFVAMWNQDQQLTVSGADLDQLVVEGTTVVVPEGKVISGNLTVTNGSAKVLGEVKGDLTVIDGNIMLASTAHIAGHVEEIDRAIDWAWYKLRSWFGTLAYGS